MTSRVSVPVRKTLLMDLHRRQPRSVRGCWRVAQINTRALYLPVDRYSADRAVISLTPKAYVERHSANMSFGGRSDLLVVVLFPS